MFEYGDSSGQASVELVAVIPFVLLLIGLCWQLVIAGQAIWLVGASAKAAARAQAVSGDKPTVNRTAELELPGYLRDGLVVSRPKRDGVIRVALEVPLVVGTGELMTVHASAQFASQRAEK